MPTYDYRCQKCGHEFELLQMITEDPVKDCPRCSGKVERLIGTGACIIFKGSGFYQTDYRSDEYKKAAKADRPTTSDSSSSKNGKKSTKKKTD